MNWWVVLLYVLAIILLGAGVILFFVFKSRKDRQRLEKLKKQDKFDANKLENVRLGNGTQIFEKQENPTKNLEDSLNIKNETINDNKTKENDVVLEDFSLGREKVEEKKSLEHAKNFRRNAINFDDLTFSSTKLSKADDNDKEDFSEDFEDEELPLDFDEEDDDRFLNYENFLKKQIEKSENFESSFDVDDSDFEDDEDASFGKIDNEMDEDLDALQDFDFSALEGKSQGQIDEIIKSLPPKAQEILMADILGRKDEDNE